MLNLESPLSTISRNCKSDLIAIGGKSLMKVLKLTENNELKVQKILKVARTSNKVGTTDLAWNNHLENILASTTLLGSYVLVWDINQINLSKLNEKIGSHTQLINRVNWNYKNANLLASCSQDGYLNIWDITNKPDQFVISMQHKEKIRDCQFSPFNEYYIMASYNSGAIKLWDTRNYKTCVKEFIQHDMDVLSIDWHPELENVFCSGSMDKNLHIWDINQSSPIQSYKTSHGTSRVKWWKKNPQYIISSYQTNNFYASMWNINIDNMPEYLYKGHKDVVTGFCWDISETRLITCSKDNWLIVNNFSDGFRCIDNVCTHFTKFAADESIYSYADTKPPKTNFNNVDYSRLIIGDNSRKRFRIKITNTNLISLTTSLRLNHYYTLSTSNIEQIFENYFFLINNTFFNRTVETNKLPQTSKISNYVEENWKYAKDVLKNYNHIAVWSQLKFLCELESFSNFDTASQNTNSGTFTYIQGNVELIKEMFINNISEIINFLVDCHADVWLATIIIYLFHDVFPFNKSKYLRIVTECFENLRRNKLYKISAKLMKFAFFDELKTNKQNSLILFSCKKCTATYDPTIFQGKCGNCNLKIQCQICLLPVDGLYIWCSSCSHGGHPEHMTTWFKYNKTCPSGCGHKCR